MNNPINKNGVAYPNGWNGYGVQNGNGWNGKGYVNAVYNAQSYMNGNGRNAQRYQNGNDVTVVVVSEDVGPCCTDGYSYYPPGYPRVPAPGPCKCSCGL